MARLPRNTRLPQQQATKNQTVVLLPHVVPGDLYRICKKIVVSPHPGNLVKEDNSQCVVFYLVVKPLERGKPKVSPILQYAD